MKTPPQNASLDAALKTSTEEKTAAKLKYEKPEIKSEAVLEAGLGAVCNGSSSGQRKSDVPCTILQT